MVKGFLNLAGFKKKASPDSENPVSGDFNLRALARSSLVVVNVSVLAKVMAFAKELVIAAAFGLDEGLDVYLLALVLIGFPLAIIINSAQTVLISHLSSRENRRDQAAIYCFISLISLIALVFCLIPYIFYIEKVIPFFASGFPQEKQALLLKVIFLLVPYYFMSGMNLLAYGVLQARRNFWLNGMLPVINPLVVIAVVLFFTESAVWWVMTISMLIGTAIEFLILQLILFKRGLIGLFGIERRESRDIIFGIMALVPGFAVASVGSLVESGIAASLDSGTVAALGYGFKLPSAINGILVSALGITVLPYFSSLLRQEKIAYSISSVNKLSLVIFVASMSLSLLLFFGSDFIVSTLYERGSFSAEASSVVSPIQQGYFMLLPFALLSMLGGKILAAMRRNLTISFLSFFVVILQIYISFQWSGTYGGAGLAWAKTVACAVHALMSLFFVYFFLRRKSEKSMLF
jgi:putative peptidoglycan lipid II flippase